ncbi:hypothetical protein D3C78_1631190 [compost metagenome]
MAAGTPELTMPITRVLPSLPRKSQLLRSMASSTASPRADSNTRRKAVGNAPISGTSIRMNRKLAPQMAARLSRRARSAGFMMGSG